MSGIGARIRAERTRQGRTLRDVSGRCGITPIYLCDIEHGNRLPLNDTLPRILKELGMADDGALLDSLNARMPPGYRVIWEDAE